MTCPDGTQIHSARYQCLVRNAICGKCFYQNTGKPAGITCISNSVKKLLKALNYGSMYLFPYKVIKIRSEKSPDEIKKSLAASIAKPDWNISFDKIMTNDILEGRVSDKGFTIVKGRYALTFGMTSLLPIMKGKIEAIDSLEGSFISIVIRPFKAGVFILSFFYILCFIGIYFSIQRNLIEVLIVCCLLLFATYFSLISKFNKECKSYQALIKGYF